uniref:WD_REPEATS_REGION domain-containing protein n=1 Tax=Parastrongyloides trichosuri TaxID=131310 RepID=A0A0N4ZEZ0_PARTI
MNSPESNVQYGCLFSTNHDIEAISCIKFDPYQNLLWYGTIKGRVASILPLEDTKYTAFPVFKEIIRSIEVVEDYVLSVSKDTFAIHSRGGAPYNYIKTSNMTDIQCSHIYKNNNSHVLLRASPKSFCTIDLEQQKEIRVVWDKKKDDCSKIKESNDFIFTCDNKGAISLRDKQSLDVITDLMAHKGCVNDFDINGNKLMSCGYTWNYKGFRQDMFLKVFDLRTLRPLPVINTNFPPTYCRFLSSISEDSFIYVSQNRQVAFSKLSTPTIQNDFFIDQESNPITCIDICPTEECIAFGDNVGTINLLTNSESPVCNLFNYEPHFADPVENYPPISFFNTNVPLNVIPSFPLQHDQMASYWPPQFCSPAIR